MEIADLLIRHEVPIGGPPNSPERPRETTAIAKRGIDGRSRFCRLVARWLRISETRECARWLADRVDPLRA